MKIDLGFIEIHIIKKKECKHCGIRYIDESIKKNMIYCKNCYYESFVPDNRPEEYKQYKQMSQAEYQPIDIPQNQAVKSRTNNSHLKISKYFDLDGFE